jgi:GWxTD domain-containing protein
MSAKCLRTAVALLLSLAAVGTAGAAGARAGADLDPETELLLSRKQLKRFERLPSEKKRGFLDEYWAELGAKLEREPDEVEQAWQRRVQLSRSLYASARDPRAQTLLLNGPPRTTHENPCPAALAPLEVWTYPVDGEGARAVLLFVASATTPGYRRWGRGDDPQALLNNGWSGQPSSLPLEEPRSVPQALADPGGAIRDDVRAPSVEALYGLVTRTCPQDVEIVVLLRQLGTSKNANATALRREAGPLGPRHLFDSP